MIGTPLAVIQDVAHDHGHPEGNCKSCRHLEPTGEREYAWCGQHKRPQFKLGVCVGWQVRPEMWLEHWVEPVVPLGWLLE